MDTEALQLNIRFRVKCKLENEGNFSYGKFSYLGKRKAIPLQSWGGPEGSRSLRLPDFMTIGT